MTKTRDLANLIADSKIGPTEIDTSGTYTLGGIAASGDLTLDVDEDIILDANSGYIKIHDDGAYKAFISTVTGHVVLQNMTANSDIIFNKSDGSAMLTLDASNDGSATFSHDIFLPNGAKIQFGPIIGSGNAILSVTDGNATLDATGDIHLDVGGAVTVNGDVNIDDAIPILRLDSPATTWSGGEDLGGLDWYTKDTSANGPAVMARIYSESSGTNTLPVPNMIFQTSVAVSLKDRMKISGTGDISFYEDTGTTAKFFWDASAEELGIGTSAPADKLHVEGNIYLGASSRTVYTGGAGNLSFQTNTGEMLFLRSNGSAESMRIDSSGNVGIATSSITSGFKMEVIGDARFGDAVGDDAVELGWSAGGSQGFIQAYDRGASAFRPLNLNNSMTIDSSGNVGVNKAVNSVVALSVGADSTATNSYGLEVTNASANTRFLVDGVGSSFFYKTDNAVGMKFDSSSGSVLVGTTNDNPTSSSVNVAGQSFSTTGGVRSTVASNPAATFNRKSDDAEIVLFRKDGSTVGSINATQGRMAIGNVDTGLKFSDADNSIMPFNVSTNANRDNAVDLGYTTVRFKDLHLSGTANTYRIKAVTGSSGGSAHANADEIVAESNTNAGISILSGQSYSGFLHFGDGGSGHDGFIEYYQGDRSMRFGTAEAEKVRLDSSGNLLVGKTALNFAEAGTEIMDHGEVQVTRAGGVPMYIRRNTSDGDLIGFYKDNTTVGVIGAVGTDLCIGTSDTGLRFLDSSNAIIPIDTGTQNTRDDAISFGTASGRYDNIYATNGTINTSDRNEKQNIEELSDAERRVAVAAKNLLRKFKWKSAVASKGDKAQIHFGIIAQDLQTAFAAESLDAGDYGMITSDTWTDDDGNEKTRLGVRYSELLAFIISAI